MEHTKEPWHVAEESFDNDGIQESVIRGMQGRAAIAVTIDFGPNNPLMREANARRIVACVNACAGIPTEHLEVGPLALATLPIIKHRDQLLSTLQDIANSAKYIPACKAKDEILSAVSGVIDTQ